MSFHVKYKPEDFMPANEEEKQSQVIMRESVGFWQDGFRRLRKNKMTKMQKKAALNSGWIRYLARN